MGGSSSKAKVEEPETVVEQEEVQSHHNSIANNMSESQSRITCQNIVDCGREYSLTRNEILKWDEFVTESQCEYHLGNLDFEKDLSEESICFMDDTMQESLENYLVSIEQGAIDQQVAQEQAQQQQQEQERQQAAEEEAAKQAAAQRQAEEAAAQRQAEEEAAKQQAEEEAAKQQVAQAQAPVEEVTQVAEQQAESQEPDLATCKNIV